MVRVSPTARALKLASVGSMLIEAPLRHKLAGTVADAVPPSTE